MDDRINQLMNFILNDQKHLKRFIESPSVFKSQKKSLLKQEITANSKPLLKGSFFSYSKLLKQFKMFYFELYQNILIKYQDKTKAPPVEHILLHQCIIGEENEVIGDSIAYGIILTNEDEIAKLVIDKLNTHKTWSKHLKKYCRSGDFIARYKVETRLYDHFYRCIDKKKAAYTAVKIINKKGLKQEYKNFVNQEIQIYRKIQTPLLPRLKKIYEDGGFIYLNFEYFQGEDLFKIVKISKLEEIAIATLTHHVLKGLKSLHAQNVFHGNLKLDNIIFGSTQRDENEIFLINLKYSDEITDFYREKLIKKGGNSYVAPEVLEGGPIGPQMDMFALGVCIYYMAFNKFPYSKIERIPEEQTNPAITTPIYKYNLDLSLLENMQNENRQNPSKKSSHILRASGIDFLMRLLDVNPQTRLQASQALTHHWFIGFTSKPQGNEQIAEFRKDKLMTSLQTILECTESSICYDNDPNRIRIRGRTFQSYPTQQTNVTQTMLSDNMNRSSNHANQLPQMTTQQSNGNIDMFTSQMPGGEISEEGSVLSNLLGCLQVSHQPPKLMNNRERVQSNSEGSTTTITGRKGSYSSYQEDNDS